GDAGVHGRADDLDTLLLVLLCADVEAADADGRHLDASPAERSVAHAVADRFRRRAERNLADRLRIGRLTEPRDVAGDQAGTADGRRLQEVTSLHGTILGRVAPVRDSAKALQSVYRRRWRLTGRPHKPPRKETP